jgi:hypothetical protein
VELLMGSPQHLGMIAAAVVDAIYAFCAARMPRRPDVARAGAFPAGPPSRHPARLAPAPKAAGAH